MQTDKRQEAVQPSGEAVALESNCPGLSPSPAAGSMVVLGESSNHPSLKDVWHPITIWEHETHFQLLGQ